MQVHHCFDEQRLATQAVDNGIWKAMEVELAVVALDDAPPLRLRHYASQCALEFVEKLLT